MNTELVEPLTWYEQQSVGGIRRLGGPVLKACTRWVIYRQAVFGSDSRFVLPSVHGNVTCSMDASSHNEAAVLPQERGATVAVAWIQNHCLPNGGLHTSSAECAHSGPAHLTPRSSEHVSATCQSKKIQNISKRKLYWEEDILKG
ncbi:hypothetical protein SRHO_G00185420 [Serrasalmus rhombeus]